MRACQTRRSGQLSCLASPRCITPGATAESYGFPVNPSVWSARTLALVPTFRSSSHAGRSEHARSFRGNAAPGASKEVSAVLAVRALVPRRVHAFSVGERRGASVERTADLGVSAHRGGNGMSLCEGCGAVVFGCWQSVPRRAARL